MHHVQFQAQAVGYQLRDIHFAADKPPVVGGEQRQRRRVERGDRDGEPARLHEAEIGRQLGDRLRVFRRMDRGFIGLQIDAGARLRGAGQAQQGRHESGGNGFLHSGYP